MTVEIIQANQKTNPQEQVWFLEGALEACRNRVRELEASAQYCAEEAKDISSMPGMTACGHKEDLEPTSQSQEMGCQSVHSMACSAKGSLDRVEGLLDRIVAEERLLKKAVEIADLCRTTHVPSSNCKELRDDDKCFVKLEKEIRQRESKLLEVSHLHEKEEPDLESVRCSSQARQQANMHFEKHLQDWEQRLSAGRTVISRQVRQSMPPRPPSAQPRTLLTRAIVHVRSPSPPAPLQGAVVRNMASLPGTPDAGCGYRMPRRSLSSTPKGCRRRSTSSCASVAGSFRSGSATTAPSSPPESKRAILPEALKRTCIQNHAQVPVASRWCAVGIPSVLAAGSGGETGWRTTHQVAF
jgi:hypothetical protein